MGNKNVTNIQFSSGIKELRWTKKGDSKDNAFNYSDFKGVDTIYLPDSIETIEQGFFMGFENLKYVYLPKGCSETLSRKFLPAGVQVITTPDEGEQPYHRNIADLPEKAVILRTREGHIIKRSLNKCDGIPKRLKTQYSSSDITEMYFTEGTTDFALDYDTMEYESITYEYYKPRNFENLNKVVFPSTMKRLPAEGFRDCHNLQTVELPQEIAAIPERCFDGCERLKYINTEAIKTRIYGRAFTGCKSLQDLRLSESLEEIGESAFRDCDGLTQVKLPQNLLKLSSRAFADSDYLSTIIIPGSIKDIHEETFENCFNLSKVEMGEGIESISTRAFEGCTSLKSLTFPSTLHFLGGNVFMNSGITDLEFKNSRVQRSHRAKEYPFGICKLNSVTLPRGNWNIIDRSLFVPGISVQIQIKDQNGNIEAVPENERRELLGLPAESKIETEGKKGNKERER